MSEFWTSDIVFMLILIISISIVCLTQCGQKVDGVSFEKMLLICSQILCAIFKCNV